MKRVLAACALCLTVAACSDDAVESDTGPTPDASDAAPDGGDAAPMPSEPEPPAPPAPPSFSCPDGWRGVPTSAGVMACDPWPETGRRDDCPDDAAHFAGEPDCVRIGSECPAGAFPEGLPAGTPAVYVDAEARGRSDGSMTDPFATVGEALSVAAPGDIVAIAKGTYSEDLVIPAGVTLWGACVAETVLTTTTAAAAYEAVIHAPEPGTALRNLTVGRTDAVGVFIEGDGSMTIDDVAVIDTRGYGVLTRSGGDLAARNLSVRGVGTYATGPRTGGRGRGIQSGSGSTFSLERVVVDQAVDGAMLSFFSGVEVSDCAFVESSGESDSGGENGVGADIQGGTFVARRLVLEGNRYAGARIALTDSSELTDVVVRRTRHSDRYPSGGLGVFLINALDTTASRVWIDDNENTGLAVYDFLGDGTSLIMEDAIITRTRPDESGNNGVGVEIANDLVSSELSPTAVTLRRVAVAESSHRGVLLSTSSVRLRGADLSIVETVGNGAGGAGIGLAVTGGSDAELERVHVATSTGVGVLLQGGEPDLSEGTTAELRRSDLRVRDMTVIDTRSLAGTGTLGRAVQVEFGALSGERIALERNREVALMAFAGSVSLSDLAVNESLGAECGDACPTARFGHGVYKGPRANVSLEAFSIASAELCGVVVDGEGLLTLRDGWVRDSEIGACIQVDGYDISLLSDGVFYSDNGTNLDATSLPVPDYLVD